MIGQRYWGQGSSWENRVLSGPMLNETHLPTWSGGEYHVPRHTPVHPSPSGKRDAGAKLRAWDANELIALPKLSSQTEAASAAIHILALELMRGPGNLTVIEMRASATSGWVYTDEQRQAAQQFAKKVLSNGWDAAVGASAVRPTSRADAIRTIAAAKAQPNG